MTTEKERIPSDSELRAICLRELAETPDDFVTQRYHDLDAENKKKFIDGWIRVKKARMTGELNFDSPMR